MAEDKALKLDVVSYVDLRNSQDIVKKNPHYVQKYHNRLKIGGYKLILDGSPQGKTAWLTEPYQGGTDVYKRQVIIFVVVMLFNSTIVSRCKLISLLNAEHQNEQLRVRSLWLSVVLFLVSAACLGGAYYLITKNGMICLLYTSAI